MLVEESFEDSPQELKFTRKIRPLFDGNLGVKDIFYQYLIKARDYTQVQAAEIAGLYELHYALAGPFAYRVIIPVYTNEGLTTWTGRSIVDGEKLRYKTLSCDAEKAKEQQLPVAKAPITDCLFNELDLSKSNGKLLLICEGPMDAIRVDYAGVMAYKGVRSTCLFGKRIHDAQIDKLIFLKEQFERIVLVLDTDAEMDTAYMEERMQPFGIDSTYLPKQYKDPGAMSFDAIEALIDGELGRDN